MSDLIIPGFVYTKDLIEQAARTEKAVAAENRQLRRRNFGWKAYSGLVTVLLALSLSALNYTVPSIRLLPILLHTSADGVTDAAVTPDSLPGNLPDAAVQAWLWQYVMHRESYSWVEADYNHYVVEAMSSVPVRDSYDAWFSGKNPQSYMNVFGDRSVIRVSFREITQWEPASASKPGRVTIHFDRQVFTKAAPNPEPAQTYTVTLEFLTNYSSGINVRDMMSFNPSRIVITNYPGAIALPAKPSVISQ